MAATATTAHGAGCRDRAAALRECGNARGRRIVAPAAQNGQRRRDCPNSIQAAVSLPCANPLGAAGFSWMRLSRIRSSCESGPCFWWPTLVELAPRTPRAYKARRRAIGQACRARTGRGRLSARVARAAAGESSGGQPRAVGGGRLLPHAPALLAPLWTVSPRGGGCWLRSPRVPGGLPCCSGCTAGRCRR